MGDRQSVENLQWLAYIGRRRNNLTHAGNWREVRLGRVLNLKVDAYCTQTGQVFEYLGCFCMGVHACPIDMNPLLTPVRHF
jgi:hypothetical protein